MPEGVTAEGLMNVAEKMNWNFRPIKRLGPAKLLIASEKTAPTQVALIEDQAVLVTEVRPKDMKQQQVILTDPQHKKQVPQNPLQISSADPWQSGADPWAQHVARSTGSQPKIPVPARVADGATANVLSMFFTNMMVFAFMICWGHLFSLWPF